MHNGLTNLHRYIVMYLSRFFLKEDILRGSELASLQAEALNHVLSFCKGDVVFFMYKVVFLMI